MKIERVASKVTVCPRCRRRRAWKRAIVFDFTPLSLDARGRPYTWITANAELDRRVAIWQRTAELCHTPCVPKFTPVWR